MHYSIFNIAKSMLAAGVGAAEVQRRGNLAYQSLDAHELEVYQKRADDANNSEQVKESAVSRTKLVRKIVSSIHANVSIKLYIIEHVAWLTRTCL